VTDTVLDARRLLCPMPVIRTQDAVQKLQPGQTLRVLSTDPGVLHDIPAWCRVHGHEVLDMQEGEAEIVIRILVCKPG
jgi:tRNA 2-thiouridine synthesizing protein A